MALAALFSCVAAASLLQRYVPQYSLGVVLNFILLFLIQFAARKIWKINIYPHYFSPTRHIPLAPGCKTFTGHTIRVFNEPSGLPQCEWVENVPNNGLIRYYMWGNERLLLTTPEALKDVLVTKNYDFIKPPQLRKGLARSLGVGILLAEGDEHKRQRKDLTPAFAYRHIKDLYPVFWEKGRQMVECVRKAPRSNEAPSEKTERPNVEEGKAGKLEFQHAPDSIEVGNWFSRATLDIIGLSGMGQDFKSLQDENNKLNQTYRYMFNPGRAGRILQILGIFLPFGLVTRLPVLRNKKLNEASTYVKEVCRDLIATKRARIAEKERTEVDIISVALESGGFTDEELVNQMMTFLVAGHETTATAMIWAVYLLCKHPEVQAKLSKEVRASLPALDQEITAADIDSCQYLKAVCNEVLRLWSPVGLTLRITACDTSINDQFVPKGKTIIIAPWAINTSKHLWGPDAKEFKPERWLDADGKANNKGGAESNFSFLTFLHGPRSCIGQKFAQAEFECLLAAWTRSFQTEFEEGSPIARGEMDIEGGVTSKPKGGLWVKVKEIDL